MESGRGLEAIREDAGTVAVREVLEMKLIVALAFAVTAVSAAHAQKGGGLLPPCSEYCKSLGSSGKGLLGACMKKNAAAGRCRLKSPVKDNRPGVKG